MRARVLVMLMVCLTNAEIPRCSVTTNITVAKLSKTYISCPHLMSNYSDFHYELFFNDRSITKINLSQNLNSAKELFSGQFEVTVHDSGKYICKNLAYYPPDPKSVQCHATEVIVGDSESLPTTNGTNLASSQSCPDTSVLIPEEVMWVGSAILLVYSLSITCFTIAVWRKMKKYEEDTIVYVNTKLREHIRHHKA